MSKKKTLVAQVREHTAKALEEFKAAVLILEDLAKKHATLAEDLAKAEPANQQQKQETPAKKRRTAKTKTQDAPAEPAPQAPQAPSIPRHRQSASVRHTPHELTLNIGSFPVQQLAEDDAKDFLNNQMVFWYRPMQFPDPRRYRVQPHIESAKVVKRADKKFVRAPWTVNVTISIVGDDKKCDAWGTGVLSKNKGDQE